MGVDLIDKKKIIDELIRNMGTDFIAEVFISELNFLFEGDDILKDLIIKNLGMNERFESVDIVDVDTVYTTVEDEFKENFVVSLARNSLYHRLPEILFHPLAIQTKTNNKKEVVNSIRDNRKKEQVNLDFFSFFDTEIFKERIKIKNRSLNFFFDKSSREKIIPFFRKIIGINSDLSNESFYALFLNLCNAEFFKENLPELERLIEIVLKLKVKISYISSVINELPYEKLGDAVLGVNMGVSGSFYSEIDDLKVVIQLNDVQNNFKILEKNIVLIKEILNFFIISTRRIFISYEKETKAKLILNNTFLGYDSYLN